MLPAVYARNNVDKKMINIPETKYVVFIYFYLAHK